MAGMHDDDLQWSGECLYDMIYQNPETEVQRKISLSIFISKRLWGLFTDTEGCTRVWFDGNNSLSLARMYES